MHINIISEKCMLVGRDNMQRNDCNKLYPFVEVSLIR